MEAWFAAEHRCVTCPAGPRTLGKFFLVHSSCILHWLIVKNVVYNVCTIAVCSNKCVQLAQLFATTAMYVVISCRQGTKDSALVCPCAWSGVDVRCSTSSWHVKFDIRQLFLVHVAVDAVVFLWLYLRCAHAFLCSLNCTSVCTQLP